MQPCLAPLWKIDPDRDLPLARAYRDRPQGPHSPETLRLLNRLRWEPLPGRFVLVARERHRSWWIGQLAGERGQPVKILKDQIFRSRQAAEWEIFKRRWKRETGEALELD